MKVGLLLLVLMLANGCAAPDHRVPLPVANVWSSSELNARKDEMDGAEIVMDVYLVHEPENYSLWDNEQAWSRGDSSSCVSLIYPQQVSEAVLRSNRKQVHVRGTFVRNVTANGGLFLGLCNYTGLRVSEVMR